MRSSDTKHQLAVSALFAILSLNALAAANTIAQTRIAPPLEVFPAIFGGLGLAAFFLPLLWWRHPAGYVGAVGVGALTLAWPLLVLGGVTGELSATVPLSPVGILTYLSMPVILIGATFASWREDASTTAHRATGLVAREEA